MQMKIEQYQIPIRERQRIKEGGDFLTSDGEKDWRNRDTEFEEQQLTKAQLITFWDKGWACCLDSIKNLTEVEKKTLELNYSFPCF